VAGAAKEAEMIGAFRQKAFDKAESMRSGENTGPQCLRRILIVIETGRAEGEVEIGHDRVELEIARYRPGKVVGDGRGADAALRTDDRDDAPDRLGVGEENSPQTERTTSIVPTGAIR